jgi:hypothetical protein
MRLLILSFAGALAAGSATFAQDAAPKAPEGPLNLVCEGDRHVVETQTSRMSISKDYDVTNSASGTTTTSREAVRHGQIYVVVDGSTVRIQPTAIMLTMGNLVVQVPKDGWYTLENPKVDADQFSGVWHLSFIQKPQFRIDRHTGSVRISSGGVDFSGVCEKTQSLTTQKF